MEAIPTRQEEKLIQQLSKQTVFQTKYCGGAFTCTSDGSNLIWVGEDATTTYVSALHGSIKFTYKGDSSDILNFAVSPNNRYLAVSYSSGLVYVYDLSIPKEHLMIIKTPNTSTKQQSVTVSMCFSYSNGFLAMGSNDGYVRIYDLQNKFFTHNLVFSHSLVTNVLFDDSKEQYLVYASSDSLETIRQFNLHTNKIKDMFGHLNGIVDMKLNTKKQLVSIGKDNVLIIWDMQTLKPTKTIPITYSLFLQFAGEYIILGTEEGNLIALKDKEIIWKNKEEQRLLSPGAVLIAGEEIIHVSHDGYLIFYSFEGKVKSYDCFDRESIICCLPLEENDEELDNTLTNEEKKQHDIEFPLHCNKVLLLNNSNALEVYDFVAHTSQLYYGHDSVIMSYCTSPSKDYIIVGYFDGSISLWDLKTMKELVNTTVHSGAVTALGHSTQSRMIATGSNDKYIKIFSYESLEEFTQVDAFAAHTKEIQCLTFSTKDIFLVSGSADKSAKLWAPKEGFALHGVLKGHTKAVISAEFSPIEQVVATASGDGTIRLWSVKSLSALRTLQGHNGGISKAIFVNDGVQIISVGNDGTVRLWVVKTGENTQTLDVSEEKLWSITKHNQNFIVTGDNGLVSLIQDISSEVVAERITSREKEILLGQKLMNLTRQGKWKEALKVCVELGLQKEALNCCSSCNVSEAIEEWDIELGKKLYEFARYWNERNVSMAVAQTVMNAIFLKWDLESLNSEEFKKSLDRMKELNTKHLQTLDGYYRKALFVDFVADQVKALP
ncbi:hypothetical protein ENUP19_0004G0022 [Entamoeba nuttalli]|uniref:Utp13 specific WD40 associated domain containing protein n=2 Tax=Entamoeba nuttalli TaxID=412467 RepID=K2GST7_ENTNP|nr:Utp13 specific WD40 associated domain containing protein [Entamoeba nuttalli P19]EKE36912.1 Utp13 specific WD40 associated domain containing protein [Entamoeba nuttalli P19]|eukprot:XP_008860745.1 Utp13 specific WD40 associated domain containing protein [Entamoeba nuttalli P19]